MQSSDEEAAASLYGQEDHTGVKWHDTPEQTKQYYRARVAMPDDTEADELAARLYYFEEDSDVPWAKVEEWKKHQYRALVLERPAVRRVRFDNGDVVRGPEA